MTAIRIGAALNIFHLDKHTPQVHYPPPRDMDMAQTAKRRKLALGHPESSAVNLPEDVRTAIDARLARIEGHVAAIRRMMAAGEDCDALLIQASAVRSALNGVLAELMEAHLTSCIVPRTSAGQAEVAIERLRKALATVLKRG